MQRLIALLGGGQDLNAHPRSPAHIAWRPIFIAAATAIAALTLYEAVKYLTA